MAGKIPVAHMRAYTPPLLGASSSATLPAVSPPPVVAITALLRACPESAGSVDHRGQLPLHLLAQLDVPPLEGEGQEGGKEGVR